MYFLKKKFNSLSEAWTGIEGLLPDMEMCVLFRFSGCDTLEDLKIACDEWCKEDDFLLSGADFTLSLNDNIYVFHGFNTIESFEFRIDSHGSVAVDLHLDYKSFADNIVDAGWQVDDDNV